MDRSFVSQRSKTWMEILSGGKWKTRTDRGVTSQPAISTRLSDPVLSGDSVLSYLKLLGSRTVVAQQWWIHGGQIWPWPTIFGYRLLAIDFGPLRRRNKREMLGNMLN